MEWSWKLFFIILPIAVIVSMFSRGAMNSQNVAQHGSKGDYKTDPIGAILGSLIGGAVWALIITAIVGLF